LSSDLAWQFVKDNWSLIYSRYSSGFLITRLVKTVAENFATKEDAEDVEVNILLKKEKIFSFNSIKLKFLD
jgi:hypothetical protein